MKQKNWYLLWGALYILCAGLGFIPHPEGFLYYFLMGIGIAFFVPGGVLLYRALKAGDKKELRRLRTLSIASLTATLIMMLLNILSVGAGDLAGNMVYALLILVSSPMVCSQLWMLSLFLWACLLVANHQGLKGKK